jgi:hypothetical protein
MTAVRRLSGETVRRTSNRLFLHDRRIAINVARATFSKWHDRLIAAFILLVALPVLHSSFADRPWTISAWAGLGAGVMAGLAAGRLVGARLAFHGFDGLLAAEALYPATRRRYAIAWHLFGLAILAAVTLVARPSLLIASLPGYLIGALAGQTMASAALPGTNIRNAPLGRAVRSSAQRPLAGAVAAAILLSSLLLSAHALAAGMVPVVAGVEAAMLVLALTIVDAGTVRFMTIAGHPSWPIVARHAQGTSLFAGVAAPVCWFAFGPLVAGIVIAVSLAALLLLAMRILAYRVHGKRFADLLVAILAALLVLTAFSLPILLPFAAILILWHLQRRAAAKTWLLA